MAQCTFPSLTERTVEDQAISLVVVDHGTAFVCVVVGPLHDAPAIGLNSVRSGIDIVGLDADDDLTGNGMVHFERWDGEGNLLAFRGAGQPEVDSPAILSANVKRYIISTIEDP